MVVDRGFLAAGILVPLARDGQNRHWLTRAKSTTAWKVIKSLGKNEDLVEFKVSSQARSYDPSLPETYIARAIRYQMKGFKPQTLLTSLLDPGIYPAKEIVGVYHERWELELGYDEIKTEMLDRLESIRSRTVVGVEQELWGILLAYNSYAWRWSALRRTSASNPHKSVSWPRFGSSVTPGPGARFASPGALPARLKTMREFFTRLVLPDRRRFRRYPRAVKIKMSNFPRKRPVRG